MSLTFWINGGFRDPYIKEDNLRYLTPVIKHFRHHEDISRFHMFTVGECDHVKSNHRHFRFNFYFKITSDKEEIKTSVIGKKLMKIIKANAKQVWGQVQHMEHSNRNHISINDFQVPLWFVVYQLNKMTKADNAQLLSVLDGYLDFVDNCIDLFNVNYTTLIPNIEDRYDLDLYS